MKKKLLILLVVVSVLFQPAAVSAASSKTDTKGTEIEERAIAEDEVLEYNHLDKIAGKETKLTKAQIKDMHNQNVPVPISSVDTLRNSSPCDKMSDDEFNSRLLLMGFTPDYSLYYTPDLGSITVETPDGKFVEIDTFFTNTGGAIEPEYCQYDFDGDGEDELMLETLLLHGLSVTMLNVEALFIVDKDDSGEWKGYYLPFEDYLSEARKHISAEKKGEEFYYLIDGKEVDEPIVPDTDYKFKYYNYVIDSMSDYIPYGKDIYLILCPLIYGSNEKDGMAFSETAGFNLSLKINYTGDGEFTFGKSIRDVSSSEQLWCYDSDNEDIDFDNYLAGPGYSQAIALQYIKVFELGDNNKQPKEMEGFILENGEPVSLGRLTAKYSTKGFRPVYGGIMVGDDHSFTKIVPDYKNKCFTEYGTAYDDGTFVNHNGKKVTNSKKYEEFEALYYESSLIKLW